MVASPVQWSSIQQALLTWVEEEGGLAGKVLWADQNTPQLDYPFATLKIISGPIAQAMLERRYDTQAMVDLVTVVNAAAQTYSVVVDGVSYDYGASGGDTVTDIRDALLALLGALANISVAASGTDSITLTGSAARPTFHTTTSPSADITRTTQTDGIRTTIYAPAEIVVRLQAFTADVKPAGHARDLVSKCLISVGREARRKALTDACVSFARVITTQDLSQVVGTDIESRFMADIAFAIAEQVSEDEPWINTVATTPTWT